MKEQLLQGAYPHFNLETFCDEEWDSIIEDMRKRIEDVTSMLDYFVPMLPPLEDAYLDTLDEPHLLEAHEALELDDHRV